MPLFQPQYFYSHIAKSIHVVRLVLDLCDCVTKVRQRVLLLHGGTQDGDGFKVSKLLSFQIQMCRT